MIPAYEAAALSAGAHGLARASPPGLAHCPATQVPLFRTRAAGARVAVRRDSTQAVSPCSKAGVERVAQRFTSTLTLI